MCYNIPAEMLFYITKGLVKLKTSKHILAGALALTMALTFAGCGDSSSDSSEKETTTTAETAAETEAAETEATEAETEAETEATEAEPEAAEFDITKVPGYDESATETVIEIENGSTSPWAAAFPGFTTLEGESSDDFIDARTFQRDKDMHIVVDFELTETLKGMIDEGVTNLHDTQIVIGPCHANGWTKFGQTPEGIICDYPQHNLATDDSEWIKKGENLVSPDDENVWCPLFVKNDGFIKITDPEITQIEFTLPAAVVNEMIDNYNDPEKGFDGILFQMGGSCAVTKVTIDQGNVFLASQLAEAGF